ncbi:unnamed protein product, partial [Prorocentrum cordatum]
VYDAMCGGNYMALPAPFRPNKDPGEIAFTVQLHTLSEEDNGRQFALKCIRFEKATRADIAKEVFVSGTALTPHWGNSPDKETPLKLFHYMMGRLGGVQIRHWIQPSVATAAAAGADVYGKGKRQAGYLCIEKYGVNESLRNYASGTVGARALGRWAVTLKRFDQFLFDRIVVPVLGGRDVHGAMWIGKTRVDKSTASKTIGFAISAYQIEKHRRADLRPSVVAAKTVDFLQICVKPYNEEFKATVKSVSREKEEVAFSDFIKTIDCNFTGEKQCSYKMADVEAYAARSNVVPLSPNWVYFRAASTTREPVPRFPWPVPAKPDLFAPETYDILKAFKKDQTRVPSDYDQHMRWAVAAMKKLARGEELGQSSTVRGPMLFDQDAPARCNFPEVATQPPSGRQGGEWFPRAAAGQPTSASCPVLEDTRDIDEQLNVCRAVQRRLCGRAVAFHGRVIGISSPQPLKRG